MGTKNLAELSKEMRKIDIAILSTHTDGGAIAARPVSNNGEVDYDGDSYYFTWEESRMVSDIEKDPKVGLSFTGGKTFMVAVEGEAELIRDKGSYGKYWTKSLDKWFDDGIDTKGVVMIKVHAKRVHWWDGLEDGEVKVA